MMSVNKNMLAKTILKGDFKMKKRRKSLLVTLVLLICVFMVPTKAQAAEEYNKKIELVFEIGRAHV